MASAAPPPRIYIDNLFGVGYIGVVVAAALWGVTAVQTWYYYANYPKDSKWLKLLVAATLFLDTLHQALISHCIYYYVVTNYNNPVGLVDMVWSILIEVAITGFTGLLVQGFLTYRCWRMTNKNYFITGVISLVVLYEFFASLVFTILAMQLKTFARLPKIKGLSMSINIAGALGSLLIAGVLVVTLNNARTGFRRSDTVISKLIIFAVNTGLLIALCATASLISILASPNTLIYVGFYFLLPRLYTNSMLATLNARNVLKGRENINTMSVSLGHVSKTAASAPASTFHSNIHIKVDTTKELVHDHENSPINETPKEISAV